MTFKHYGCRLSVRRGVKDTYLIFMWFSILCVLQKVNRPSSEFLQNHPDVTHQDGSLTHTEQTVWVEIHGPDCQMSPQPIRRDTESVLFFTSPHKSSAYKYNPHFQFLELSQSPASEDTSFKHTKDISHGPSVFSCGCELGIGRKRRKVFAFICSMAPIPLSTRAVLPDAANSAKPISISACSLLLPRLLSAILT